MIKKCKYCKRRVFENKGWKTTDGDFVCMRCRIELLSQAFSEHLDGYAKTLPLIENQISRLLDVNIKTLGALVKSHKEEIDEIPVPPQDNAESDTHETTD